MLAATTHVTAPWAATRATGIISLVLLSLSMVLGIASSAGVSTRKWPRFASQELHRNVSLLCLALLAIHVVTTVIDGYVRIGFVDSILPFRSGYRPVYVGLGTVAADVLVALLATSLLRARVGYASWRAIHWAAYLCWPLALVHALGTGTDTRMHLVALIELACAVAVVGMSLWWVWLRKDLAPQVRAAGAAVAVTVALAIAVFAAAGPLRSGWAKRAGAPGPGVSNPAPAALQRAAPPPSTRSPS